MSSNFKRYLKETLSLSRSIVLKSEPCAIEMNNFIERIGLPVDHTDPSSWRYYLNLAGEYHALDVPMEIISLDTLETIPFTKAGIEHHFTTQKEYRVGSEFYKALLAKYPHQELLIRGILTPVDIEHAIEAPDLTILYIDEALIEENETNLLRQLQQRIYAFEVRWNNPAYNVVDDLYVTAFLGMLFYQIPLWLMNIRLANCRTGFVHSYHIREYLKSHGRLDRYFDYLTRKQVLFLYRNILYIERNAGKQDTLNWLVEKLLTDRGIGLAEFNLHHNLEPLPEELYPEIDFTRRALNVFHRSGRSEDHTFEEMLFKERPVAEGNLRVEEQTLLDDTRRIQNAKRGHLPTKVLESAIIDWSESGVIVRSDFLLNHWAYWSSTGRYNTIVRVNHPQTGLQMEIQAKDAFILFLYAFNRSVGITLDTIPAITTRAIRRQPTPSFAELRSIVEPRYVGDELVQMAANQQFTNFPVHSNFQFVTIVDALFKTFYVHREVYSLAEHQMARGQLQALMDHLYMNVDTHFTDTETQYTDWIELKQYDFETMSPTEFGLLAVDLMVQATGINLEGNFSVSDIQAALIRLMTQLSSYSIQFVTEANVGPIMFWDWPATRVGQIDQSGQGFFRAKVLGRNPLWAKMKGKFSVHFDVNSMLEEDYSIRFKEYGFLEAMPKINVIDRKIDFIRYKIPMAKFKIHSSEMVEV